MTHEKFGLIAVTTLIGALTLQAGAGIAQDLDPETVRQPAGFAVPAGDKDLIVKGETLFKDTSLSTNEMACASCHADFGAFNDTFKEPYPHRVQMAKDRTGLDPVTAAEMVQLCMMVPMDSKPLDWDGEKIKALTAYVVQLREQFSKKTQ